MFYTASVTKNLYHTCHLHIYIAESYPLLIAYSSKLAIPKHVIFLHKNDQIDPLISFVALIWTFSIFSISHILLGAQTVLAYSKFGLTKLLYKTTKHSQDNSKKFLCISPNIEYALLTILLICWSNNKKGSNKTPRSSYDSTCSNGTPSILYVKLLFVVSYCLWLNEFLFFHLLHIVVYSSSCHVTK